MIYSLVREHDGAGDSGPMSMALNTEEVVHNSRPMVGYALRVGSIFARSYQPQDWWQTTFVTEILEDTPDMVRFKTTNSIYVWKRLQ